MEFQEIKKVRKEGNIKKITIPQDCPIEAGDFVMIKKIPNNSTTTPQGSFLGADAVS